MMSIGASCRRAQTRQTARAQELLHPVYFLFPKRLAEARPELLDVNDRASARQKMPELGRDDEQN